VLLKGEAGRAYNVGNPDTEISVKDLAHLLVGLFPEMGLSVVHMPSDPQAGGYLQSQVSRSMPLIQRMLELGWRPTTGLVEGFMRTVSAMRWQP
jgi:UDP-glucuronate decarboxylase